MDIHSLVSTWRARYQKRSPREKKMLKFLVLLLGILLLIIFLKCCKTINMNKQTANAPLLIRENNRIKIPENSPLRSQINVQTVNTSNLPHLVTLPGIVDGNQAGNLSILPPLTGHLVSLNVRLGDEVKKDQILAVMQSAALAQAYSDQLKAQSALKQVQKALKRAQKVNRVGANSIKDIEQLQNNYTQAQAELQRTQATLESLGNNKESQLQIIAPMNGKITTLNYGIGSYINDSTIPLFTLSNIDSVWVTLCVPENLITSVTTGQSVEVFLAAYPNQTWQGKITFTNALIDPDTRCNKSRIALDNSDMKLQPNMFTAVKIQIPQTLQVMVPLSAILMNNDTTSVFIEITPWTFKRRVVVLGAEDGTNVRINSGLQAGDRIITAGGILVND
ncbi:efflux RND transporter periplasmic adaptor subunit [Legionella sp.]|uniref:efflux RND transporter periplasmic adaptor subunit n=1 Tax=Legionella sp. TaxID=459 RepID=UPI003C9E00FF